MSFDFLPEFRETDIVGYGFACACGDATSTVVSSTAPGAEALRGGTVAQTIACGDDYCDADRSTDGSGFLAAVYAEEMPGLNVGTLKMADVCALLGIERDEDGQFEGSMSGTDMLGRVLMALAVNPADEGVPAYEEQRDVDSMGSPIGMRVIDCGRMPGYFERVLGDLHTLAQWCIERERNVVWY